MATKGPIIRAFDPDAMVETGLADDFDGGVVAAEYCAWDFGGKAQEYGCTHAVRLAIQPSNEADIALDEETGRPRIQDVFYTVSSLLNFVPSEDGETPAGGIDVETYASLQGQWQEDGSVVIEAIPEEEDLAKMRGPRIAAGVRTLERLEQNPNARVGLPNNSNFAFFLTQLKEAGFTDFSESIDGLAGTLYGHWNRLPPTGRKQREGAKATRDVLVLTEILEAPKGFWADTEASTGRVASEKGKAATSKPKTQAKATETGGEDDFSERVGVAILETLAENDGSMNAKKLLKAVMDQFEKSEKAQAFKLMQQGDFMTSSELWSVKGDTVSLA